VTDSAALFSIERRLSARRLDFSEAFVRVGQLKSLLDGGSVPATGHTIAVLSQLLPSRQHREQTQAFHFFESVAGALAAIGCSRYDPAVSRRALKALVPAATDSRGEIQRASAETVGTLPVNIRGPRLPREAREGDPPRRSLKRILSRMGHARSGAGEYLGRSLVVPLLKRNQVLVIKMTRSGEDPGGLRQEARWMDYLNVNNLGFTRRFIIPRPLAFGRGYLFKPAGLPGLDVRFKGVDPATVAIAFTVHRDYFVYPNDHRPGLRLSHARFRRVLLRAAGLFGELAAIGIIHTAPVPLFHNRAQQNRREDGGIYEWDRAGRLDRWLLSSRYPNFGPTGIRDFEHLASVDGAGGRHLYRHIGNHLLSLILVAGSHFRHKAPEMMGTDGNGAPLDMRHLFDQEQYIDLVDGLFGAYYTGFSKDGRPPDMKAAIAALVTGLIEQMGVDRYMREILRREDQKRMPPEAFKAFLDRYNLTPANDIEKGRADIEVHTGPHLGEFNGPISVPELTAFLRSAAAVTVAGRFMAQGFSREKGGAHG